MLNDPLGLGWHGLPAGRRWRAAGGGGGRPSPTGSKLVCPLLPECCRGTGGLGCGRGRQRFDAQCALWVCSTCLRAVRKSSAWANFGSAPRHRMTSQLITIRCTIDLPTWVGSAVAVALACGAFLDCRDRVCVISRGARCGRVPGGARSDLRSSPQIFHEHNRHGFEILRSFANFPARGINFFTCRSRDIHTV